MVEHFKFCRPSSFQVHLQTHICNTWGPRLPPKLPVCCVGTSKFKAILITMKQILMLIAVLIEEFYAKVSGGWLLFTNRRT